MSSQDAACDSASSFSLIVGLQTGDPGAWSRLVDLYGPLVRSWCVYSGVSGDRIGDVVQEVFLSIHRSCGGFQKRDGDTGFRGWIWMITKNKIRDHFRAASKQALSLIHI